MARATMAKSGAEQDERDGRQRDVEEALDDEADDAVRAVDERQDLAPVEVLDAAAGQADRQVVERDADDLALLLAQPGDRLDPVQVIAPAGRPRPRRRCCSWRTSSMSSSAPSTGRWSIIERGHGLDRQEADDPQPELAMALDPLGEPAGLRPVPTTSM